MPEVTLDALIQREDFEIQANTNQGQKIERISIRDLESDSFFFPNVRKPDFQRETNEWDKNRICQFIKSFVEGDLIPAYWSNFTDEQQSKIEKMAKEINAILFEPKLQTPIKTLDLPVCGKLYSAETLRMILSFVNIANKIEDEKTELEDDTTGETTIRFLNNTIKIARRLNSDHSSSLGLHPMIYCYSLAGRHRSVSFLGTIHCIMMLEEKKLFNDFIEVREQFEKFLIDYNDLTQQIMSKYRSVQASYQYVSKLFIQVIKSLNSDKTISEVIDEIISSDDFKYLNVRNLKSENIESNAKDFNKYQKSEVYIREVLPKAPRCKICNGLIHKNSISIDHIQRKEDGGKATLDNGQITHPYCNSTYKN